MPPISHAALGIGLNITGRDCITYGSRHWSNVGVRNCQRKLKVPSYIFSSNSSKQSYHKATSKSRLFSQYIYIAILLFEAILKYPM